MPNNLMVLQDAWHWRKANYWDMPKCATCEHWITCNCEVCEDMNFDNERICNHQLSEHHITSESFGCVYHSSIAMPVLLHTPTEPLD